MNGLSWLLYAAEVVGSLGTFLGFTTFILGFAVVCLTVVFGVSMDPYCGMEKLTSALRRTLRWLAPVTLAVALLTTLLPSSKTVYMIAASEMGQKVYETPAAQEVLTDLQVILKQKLGEMRKEGSK